MSGKSCVFTDYLKFRATLRGFDLKMIEEILRHSDERYFDVETQRSIIIGEHHHKLAMIPYELSETEIIPITIHATTRQQIKFRLNTGRFIYE